MISTLSDLIAATESNNFAAAVRFEPLHKPAPQFVSRMADVAKCSHETAYVLCSCSWGLYQIMGDELIALGLKFSPLEICLDTGYQNLFLAKFLVEKGLSDVTLSDILNNPIKREQFATKYNGPGNVAAYSERLLDVYAANK